MVAKHRLSLRLEHGKLVPSFEKISQEGQSPDTLEDEDEDYTHSPHLSWPLAPAIPYRKVDVM